jgi:hypothetical protein
MVDLTGEILIRNVAKQLEIALNALRADKDVPPRLRPVIMRISRTVKAVGYTEFAREFLPMLNPDMEGATEDEPVALPAEPAQARALALGLLQAYISALTEQSASC